MQIPLLTDITIILALSAAVLLLFQKLKLPPVLGFLITGTIAGPHALSLVTAYHEVEILAEVGIILLLFTIGLEFSIAKLIKLKKSILLGGSLQVFGTVLLTALICYLCGFPPAQSCFVGALVSLSSTAIVLKILQSSGDVDSPYGKNLLAILIFQDIIVVPMMILVPFLSGVNAPLVNDDWLFGFIKTLVFLVFALALAYFLVPKLLDEVAKSRNYELFLSMVIVICFAIAYIVSSAGLSLALGAFLAGLIISESEHSSQAISNILPFKGIFSSLFFVSVGMLLNIDFVLANYQIILILTAIVLSLKILVAALSGLALGLSLRTIVILAFALSQLGEFSFILAKEGLESNILPEAYYQYFLAVSILTMILTSPLINFSRWIGDRLINLKIPRILKLRLGFLTKEEMREIPNKLHDHIIIIGFGINGRNIAEAARKNEVPYLVLELNSETVKRELKNNEPIVYADALQVRTLEKAFVHTARMVVVSISDLSSTMRLVKQIRSMNKEIIIIARTRYLIDIEQLKQLGATEVIAEELETAKTIFEKVLNYYA
jgi:CPA2 family monovalent cation:H+ antiporter-2